MINDTKEFLVVVNEILLFLIQRLSDGIGVEDFFATWNKLSSDPEFQAIVRDAVDGISKIPGEVESMSMQDTLELVFTQTGYIPKFIDALKKKS